MRKHNVLYLWFFLLACFSLKAFSANEDIVIYGSCKHFEVFLPANPTTGYQWSVQGFDRERFKLTKDTFVNANYSRAGAPGVHVYFFDLREGVECPKDTTICFSYARAWEPDAGVCKQVSISFKDKVDS